ncbi:hypothetical protein [Deinococcus planocerae]|uniref:hypothetical protein n=1 Tax=Deinococcus planocerae TaxID=1737569 RepID=UPI000C7F1073|nr:hypothetical protein [Deinococcus planocerae]
MNATLPRPRPPAPLAARRRVVLLAVGGYLLMLLGTGLRAVPGVSDWLWGPLSLLGLVTAWAAAFQLMLPVRLGLPYLKAPGLDERQWQRLAQAHVSAYRVVGILILLGYLYFQTADRGHSLPVPRDSFTWTALWSGAMLLICALPGALLAWTEPDPPGE